MAGVSAGLAVFETRMQNWVEGKVGPRANPFRDNRSTEDDQSDENVDPNETPELRSARRNADRYVDTQLRSDERWKNYVDNAVVYYDFDEAQATAAKAILDDCETRLKNIQTSEWRKKVRKVQVDQNLGWSLDNHFRRGPWKYQLELEEKRLLKPVDDLTRELKERIERIPSSKQKAAAAEAARRALLDRSMKTPAA